VSDVCKFTADHIRPTRRIYDQWFDREFRL